MRNVRVTCSRPARPIETVTPVREAVNNWTEGEFFVPVKPVPRDAKFTRQVLGGRNA